MTKRTDGFHLLADELNPSAVKSILAWRDHPELGRLLTKLLSHTSRKAFLDSFAEALVALHLLSKGCQLRCEIPTPTDKRSDFEVRHGKEIFYLHVKRVDTDLPRNSPRQLRTISNQLRSLERIARPYIVQARWNRRLSATQMRLLVKQSDEFIRRSRVGDEMIARDESGKQIGGVRIIAPWDGDHVTVTVGLGRSGGGFIDQSPRFRKMMERAHPQFMPRAANVILIGSDHIDDMPDFESALLGSHIERWDAFPPRGKRLAHGRAQDGFWSGPRVPESKSAGWFHFTPGEPDLRTRLWLREGTSNDSPINQLLNRIFTQPDQ